METNTQYLDGLSLPNASTPPPHENGDYGLDILSNDNNNSGTNQLLFVDSNVQDYQTLIDNLAQPVDVVILDSQRDGITQITESLNSYDSLDSIHIISHGDVGQLNLGNTKLRQDNLSQYVEQLTSWSDSMDADADILLYGCNVGGDLTGEEFIQSLGQYTDADILASDDLTGSANLGGDWDLEYAHGDIEANSIFKADVADSYNYALFDPGQFSFNPVDFDFTSVGIDGDTLRFGFDSEFDSGSLTDVPDPTGFAFDDFRFDYGSMFSFEADEIFIDDDSVDFEFEAGTFEFDALDAFRANSNLFEYKISGTDILAMPNSMDSMVIFNASDFRALDYAFSGDEMFDHNFYLSQGVAFTGMNPFTDYIEGGFRLADPNALFTVDYYLENNPDVAAADLEPLTHFAQFANQDLFSARDPNQYFDSSYYLAQNPDVAAAGVNPLLHYLNFGWKESRANNPDGFNPNRDPSQFFDTSFYFDKNPDVSRYSFEDSTANALEHFINFGSSEGRFASEGRTTHPLFETENLATFSSFINSNSENFELFRDDFNSGNYGFTLSAADDGQILVASTDITIPGFDPLNRAIEFFVGGIISINIATYSFLGELVVDGVEQLFEASVIGDLQYSNYGFVLQDLGGLSVPTGTPPFPDLVEEGITFTSFPQNPNQDDLLNSDGSNIFYTPLEPFIPSDQTWISHKRRTSRKFIGRTTNIS